jgi:hypothetical protein
MHLQQWFGQHSAAFTIVVAYIPLVATVTTTILSIVLAHATLRYAEATDKSLALARDEFERQWSPELHIKVEKVGPHQARIVVTNLAKISVLLQMMQLRRISMGVPSMRSFLNEPLVGGCTWVDDLGKRLFACTGDDYNGQIAACMTFYVSGRLYRTDWFRFQLQISRGEILRLDPVNIAARKVRIVDGAEKTRQQLVKDVVEPAVTNA